MINPNLDVDKLAEAFKVQKKLKIENFMQADIIERMYNACLTSVPFKTIYFLDGKYQNKSQSEMLNMNQVEAKDTNDKITAAAQKGVGFLYEGYLKSWIKSEVADETNSELTFLHQIFNYMQSDEILNKIRQITGNQDITNFEPQYTRFTPGHFLTRHRDVVPGRGRRYACVLSMTKDWHPDWGGLLQFYKENGSPVDAWMPQFNALSIFDVSYIHSVTYITPYATNHRLSLTGWYVAKN